MTGKAIVFPGSFGNSSLERIDLNAPPNLPGAVFDFAADSLPLGPLAAWRDLVAGNPWTTYGGVKVIDDGGGRAVETNGVDGLMLRVHAMSQPHTVVIVARYKTIPVGGALLMNTNPGDQLNVGVGSSGGGYISSAGKSGTAGTGQPLVDLNYHVLITVFNGTSSSVMADNAEATGLDLGINARSGIRGGYGTTYSNIAYKRVALFPTALDLGQRNSVRNAMRAQYPGALS